MNSATVNHLVVNYYFVYKNFILPAPFCFLGVCDRYVAHEKFYFCYILNYIWNEDTAIYTYIMFSFFP